MRTSHRLALVHAAAVAAVALAAGPLRTPAVLEAVAAPQESGAPAWAIRGARVVPVSGPPVEQASVVLRNGLIEDVGADAAIPADAVVIDGSGLTVYPGLIDMANAAVVDLPDDPAPAGGRAEGAGGRGQRGAPPPPTFADVERARRAVLLKPDLEVARYTRFEGPDMQALASAGVTAVLAIPASGLIRGQSALVNVMLPPEDPEIGTVGEYRRGRVVLKSPVAQHISFTDGGAQRGGYPGALLGTMGFVRQVLYDARWQRDARAWAERHHDQPLPAFEPALDALVPVLERRVPAAFAADQSVEIQRALGMAREFDLDPLIVGGAQSAGLAADLKAASARVIYSLNFPQAPGEGRGGRGRGGARGNEPPPEESSRERQARLDAPKGPAALLAAGVPFAFGSDGLEDMRDFVRNAARTVEDGGLGADAALRALTVDAAAIAGVGERLGTIEKGKIANLIVTSGDLFADGTKIRHVFIGGYPVDIDEAADEANGRRGGGPR